MSSQRSFDRLSSSPSLRARSLRVEDRMVSEVEPTQGSSKNQGFQSLLEGQLSEIFCSLFLVHYSIFGPSSLLFIRHKQTSSCFFGSFCQINPEENGQTDRNEANELPV